MMIRPIVFTTAFLLGALILAVFFMLDEFYLGSFFSTWHVEFGLFTVIWFTYGQRLRLPESTLKLLVALLVFFISVYVSCFLFLPGFSDESWLGTTAHSTIWLTSMAIVFWVISRRSVFRSPRR